MVYAMDSGMDAEQRSSDLSSTRVTRLVKTCDNCRRRKVKCDRAQPCSRCRDQAIPCISSKISNLPRGRKGGRRKTNIELNARVAKLEDLINQVAEMAGASTADQSNHDDDMLVTSPKATMEMSPKDKIHKYDTNLSDRHLAANVFTNICQDVRDLAEFLNESSDDEDDENDSKDNDRILPEIDEKTCSTSRFPFSPYNAPADDFALHSILTNAHVDFLLERFVRDVDPVIKVLHPALLRQIAHLDTDSIVSTKHSNGLFALKCAVLYVTVTSLPNRDCTQYLNHERGDLLLWFQRATETAMTEAQILTSENINVLQALVFYLYALRSNDASKKTWTLTSLAVRLAQSLDLHREVRQEATLPPYSAFDTELRRRLWWQISLLDRHASFDRASDPIIAFGAYNTRMPLNINDCDLNADTTYPLRDREEYTDLTLSLVCYAIFDNERQLNFVPPRTMNEKIDNAKDWWSHRRALAMECESRLRNEQLKHCSHDIPVQRYAARIGECMIAHLWLIVYRPLQKHPSQPSSLHLPPNSILLLAIRVIESMKDLETDPLVQNYRWLSSIWVQWHALAVILAELHVHVEGIVVERAWTLLDGVFDHMGEHIADSRQGRVWRFIAKMMAKAREIRKSHLESIWTSDPGKSEETSAFDGSIESASSKAQDLSAWSTSQMQSSLAFTQRHRDNPFWGQSGAFVGEDLDDWPHTLTDSTQDIDRSGVTEWDAFVNEYQSMAQFTY